MAGSKVNMRQFELAMDKAIKEVESVSSMRSLGEEMAERIRKRTRLGKGVAETGAAPQPLKPLSASYKATRAGKIAFATAKDGHVYPYKPDEAPKLHPHTTPGRSNLTRTGQMLDSLRVIAVRVGVAVLGLHGPRNDSKLSNADVGGYVSKERPFLNLSKPELNGLATLIRERIEAALRKFRA